MIVHPLRARLDTVPNSRRLAQDFGLIGQEFWCDDSMWTIVGVYAPIKRRAIGGIRARLYSCDGLVSFINQRDLEVLLGLGAPGGVCPWLVGTEYPEPGSPNWFGTFMDPEDLWDDLFEWELGLREQYPGTLPQGIGFERALRIDVGNDIVEYNTLIQDWDPETGETPDVKFDTARRRWVRVEARRFEI